MDVCVVHVAVCDGLRPDLARCQMPIRCISVSDATVESSPCMATIIDHLRVTPSGDRAVAGGAGRALRRRLARRHGAARRRWRAGRDILQ